MPSKWIDETIENEKKNRRCSRCGTRIVYPKVFCAACEIAITKAYQESLQRVPKKTD